MAKNVRDTADASVILNSFRKSNDMGRAINEQTKWIKATGSKLDAVIHAVAVGSIYMSMPLDEHGYLNFTPALNLMNSMPKGSRAKALAAWFEAYSNIRVKMGKDGVWTGGLLKPEQKGYEPAKPEDAFAKPFWSVEEAKVDPKAFLLGEQLARLIKMASKPENMAGMSDAERDFLKELQAVAIKAPKPVAKAEPATAGDPLENAG